MTITTDAKTIIDRASTLLNDTQNKHWYESELLGYLNAGQLEIATLANGNPKVASVQLAAGVMQALPSDGAALIDILYNMGAAGATIGTAINRVPLEIMRKRLPNWMTTTANGVVKHYVYNGDDPLRFMVYPPQPATPQYVEINYSAVPAVITNCDFGTKITIADYYANPLLDYVMYRALGKDSEYGNQAGQSQGHYQAFAQFLGIKLRTDNSANNKAQPTNQAQ
ncbi:MAG: hypothetical protein Q8L15_18515 [Methylobacter sp.]|nr:hypothetical protein [Methylobacter sp.]